MARQQKRVTRKELKEDPLMTALSDARSWWEMHGTKATIGIIAVVVIIFGIIFVGKMKDSAEAEASARLMEITQNAGTQTPESLIDPLQSLVDDRRREADANAIARVFHAGAGCPVDVGGRGIVAQHAWIL